MKAFISLLLLLTLQVSKAQYYLDYKDVKDSLTTLTCGAVEMSNLIQSRTKLENFDPSCLRLGKDLFFKDLGFSYYLSYAKTRDSTYLIKAISAYNYSIDENPEAYSSLWDLSLCYYFSSQPILGLAALERYKTCVPKKYFNRKEYRQTRKLFTSMIAMD